MALLQHMNSRMWHDCCKETCNQLNSLGKNQATFYKIIAQWNMIFRKFECFPHPNPYVQCGKQPLPQNLEIFPDAKDQIVGYGVMNLATLTIEGVHDFIVSLVIPRLAAVWKKDQEEDTTDSNHSGTIVTTSRYHQHDINESFLQAHRLESMSFTRLGGECPSLAFDMTLEGRAFKSTVTSVTMSSQIKLNSARPTILNWSPTAGNGYNYHYRTLKL
jgi:hypothetical protein